MPNQADEPAGENFVLYPLKASAREPQGALEGLYDGLGMIVTFLSSISILLYTTEGIYEKLRASFSTVFG